MGRLSRRLLAQGVCCKRPSSSPATTARSRCELAQARSASSSRPRTNVVACSTPDAAKDVVGPFEQRGADHSGLGIRLAFSRWAPKPTAAGSTRATFLTRDVSSPWICRGCWCMPPRLHSKQSRVNYRFHSQAGVAELADAQDLKSWVRKRACGFDSRPRHFLLTISCRCTRVQRCWTNLCSELVHSVLDCLPWPGRSFRRIRTRSIPG